MQYKHMHVLLLMGKRKYYFALLVHSMQLNFVDIENLLYSSSIHMT